MQATSCACAAISPKWATALLEGEEVFINGDGGTTRDFCHIENALQANLFAAMTQNLDAINQGHNILLGWRVCLDDHTS